MRSTQEPVIQREDGSMPGERITHPCFAQISGSRRSGNSVLYDSDFQHQHTVCITINTSELKRSLSSDWHHAKNQLIEVELSEAQWATFVSSLNVGGGVPCTLRYKYGESIPGLAMPINNREKFKVEVNETLQEGLDTLKKLREELEASKLSQKDKARLAGFLTRTERCFGGSFKFVADQFDEHIENTVERAKVEVNAYVNNMVMRSGIAALQNGEVKTEILKLHGGDES